MPSRALLRWFETEASARPEPAIYVSCRQAWHGGYSRLEEFYFNHARPDFLAPQPRLFRPGRISWVTDLHTAGIDATGAGWAPSDAYFLHCDWLVRDRAARTAKLLHYEAQCPGGGRRNVAYSLPEIQHPERLRITPYETTEFETLLGDLAAL
jgi:hypothetical protein